MDYGLFLDNVVARINIRQLPKVMKLVKPLAVQLVVSGSLVTLLTSFDFFIFSFY